MVHNRCLISKSVCNLDKFKFRRGYLNSIKSIVDENLLNVRMIKDKSSVNNNVKNAFVQTN